MTKEEYRKLTAPGVILNSASRKAVKRYEWERRSGHFACLVIILVFWMFVYHFIRYMTHA